MKKLIFLGTLCLLFNSVIGQKMTPEAIAKLSPEKQEEVNLLIKQGNSAKIASIAVSAGGGVISIVGLAMMISAENNDDYYDGGKYDTGLALFITGSAVALSSLIFTVIKRMKYNKAKAIVFAQPGVSMVPGKLLPNTQSVGLRINIPLGR